jgi:MSHA biogenesis protein MshL
LFDRFFKINRFKIPFLTLASFVLVACAHQSKVTQSEGHIDTKESVTPIKENTVQAPIPQPIRSSPVLPPPKPTKIAQTYSVVVNEVPVKEILFALARESKINVDIDPAIQGRATLNAVDQTLPAILERLSRQVDLTYRMEGNVLVITPDQPVLRSYKVDYVNMNRDTKSFIGVAAEISSTGQSAATGTGAGAGGQQSANASGGNVNNSSRTAVSSESNNHLWESLIKNIEELLAETDKEVIVRRYGTLAGNEEAEGAKSLDNKLDKSTDNIEKLDDQRSEYKTLFASNVIANAETGVISVRATNKQHQKVQDFIDRVMGSAKKQVLIEATIVEVQLNDGFKAGIDWSRLNNAGNSGFTFQQSFTPSRNETASNTAGNLGLIAGYFNPVSSLGNIAASISLLKQFGNTKVLSSPKLMVLNNQTAILKVVDNLVYFTVQAQQSQAAVGGGVLSTITTTPNTVPVGIVMSVTPQINQDGNVNVNVRPTISSLIRYVPDPNPNVVALNNQGIPEIQVREMESLLQIPSGNIAILGGLMQDDVRANTDQVPGLSDIPGVGQVFTGRNDSNSKTELVIFLRPTVISNASLESDELSSFKKYLPAQQLQKALDEAN